MKDVGIFSKTTMVNNLHSIVQENRCQLLDALQPDPVQYISHHSGIERLSKRYRVDVSYPVEKLAYCRLTRRIQPSISSLRIEV
jgi:hypothetical protein